MTVEWREVPGYPRYLVSNGGEVKSLAQGPERVLRQNTGRGGYKLVSLWKQGATKGYCFKVHRLVAITFLADTYFEGAHVRHLDGVRDHNHVSNLAWGTPAENMQDRINHGNNPFINKTHCKWGHEFTPENTWKRTGNIRQCLICKRRRNREYMRGYDRNRRTAEVFDG